MGKRILIVDDQEDITDSLKMGLEFCGFQVDAFNDPEAALKRYKPGRYDVAILDVRMPKMNGFELCRRMRKMNGQTRVAFLTAFDVSREEFEKTFPDLKADVLLRKPIAIADLSAMLNEMIPAKTITLAHT